MTCEVKGCGKPASGVADVYAVVPGLDKMVLRQARLCTTHFRMIVERVILVEGVEDMLRAEDLILRSRRKALTHALSTICRELGLGRFSIESVVHHDHDGT